jgi:hypothetical protein
VATDDHADLRPDPDRVRGPDRGGTVNEPRLTTVMGVARAVLTTVRPEHAVPVLVDEFGWDATFQALAVLGGEDAREAFGVAWSALVLDVTSAAVDAALEPGAVDGRS